MATLLCATHIATNVRSRIHPAPTPPNTEIPMTQYAVVDTKTGQTVNSFNR